MINSYSWLRKITAERRIEVLKELKIASKPTFDYFLLVFLSCIIATLGLITDSSAVIIGAMLIAPLMTPILGFSVASISSQRTMSKNAILAILEGVVFAIFLSTLIGWIAHALPFGMLDVLPREVLIRVRPNPFDLMIAIAGGAAAAYALAQPYLSAALPGVAIATALMPPLCTVGIGLSLGRWETAGGALLLFITNFAAISLGSIIVFLSLGFRPLNLQETIRGIPVSLVFTSLIVTAILITLAISTIKIVNQADVTKNVKNAVTEEFKDQLPTVELVSIEVDDTNEIIHINATIYSPRSPSHQQVVKLQSAVANRVQRSISLQLIYIQSSRLDPLIPPTTTPTSTPGPSRTPTVTPSSTATSSPTATATSTSSPTPTNTSTATPVLATIGNSDGIGTVLRDIPDGSIVGFISEGTLVQILYRRELINHTQWIEIRDLTGRTGWVDSRYLLVKP